MLGNGIEEVQNSNLLCACFLKRKTGLQHSLSIYSSVMVVLCSAGIRRYAKQQKNLEFEDKRKRWRESE